MKSNREVLQNILESKRAFVDATHGDGSCETFVASLRNSCDRFANWRWKTLSNVTVAFIRMEQGVRVAIDDLRDISLLGSRDLTTIKQVVMAVRSPEFWARAHAL